MSSAVITISSKSSPSKAADMMLQDNVRHLPVVDNGMRTDPLVGLLRFTSQDTRMTVAIVEAELTKRENRLNNTKVIFLDQLLILLAQNSYKII